MQIRVVAATIVIGQWPESPIISGISGREGAFPHSWDRGFAFSPEPLFVFPLGEPGELDDERKKVVIAAAVAADSVFFLDLVTPVELATGLIYFPVLFLSTWHGNSL